MLVNRLEYGRTKTGWEVTESQPALCQGQIKTKSPYDTAVESHMALYQLRMSSQGMRL
jgi:hypothetical protein